MEGIMSETSDMLGESPPPRLPYEKPALQVHGKIGEITASGGIFTGPQDTTFGPPTCFRENGPNSPGNIYPNCWTT